jgi:prephenate dehydrogenase
MRIAILGLGLIGGSIARALARVGGEWTAAAWTPSRADVATAATDGVVVPAPSAREAIDGAQLVVIAAPPLETLELIDALAGAWRASLSPDAVVTDVASTKRLIVARAEARGLPFVGGHPMAGRETSGYSSSAADLFDDRPWVLVPASTASAAGRDRVETLVRACGARPVSMSAADHDAAVAAISHVPLIASAALVEAIAGSDGSDPPAGWPSAAALAATGWQSATRLARGDARMGAGILATNADAVVPPLRRLRESIDAWLRLLEVSDGPDETILRERLSAVRGRLEDDR